MGNGSSFMILYVDLSGIAELSDTMFLNCALEITQSSVFHDE
jgi:hypothetical protein